MSVKNKFSWCLSLFFLLFVGCVKDKRVTHYDYDGVIVTRLDIGTDSYFYYGKYTRKEVKKQENYLKAWPRGFNGMMGGLLIFHSDKTVEFVQGEGNFEEKGENDSLFFSRDKCTLREKEHFPYDSMVYISDYHGYEYYHFLSDSSNVIVNVIDSCKGWSIFDLFIP
jgi:hypothetical protein